MTKENTFKRNSLGYYRNTTNTIEIRKYRDMWEVYSIRKFEKAKYIGFAYTLREAKEIANKYESK